MKLKLCLFLSVALFITSTAIGAARQDIKEHTSEPGKIPAEIWQTVRKKGVAFVIVQLNVPWKPEGNLSPQERQAQREAISAAQDQLLAELAGTNYRLVGRLRHTPSIGLDVGQDALEVLERKVTEDLPINPSDRHN